MKNMKESEKQLLIKKIINEYEVAYKEIVAGTLEKIPVGRKKMKKTFSKQNGNWGLTTGKLRKVGTLGDTTTTYRLEKLAALGLFSSEDFQNYAGDLHEDIGYNHHDAKYIMIYLYNRVINRKQNSKDKAPEYDDFGIEELPVKTEGAKSSTFTLTPVKHNYAEEDEKKRELGTKGEKWVCEEEKKRLRDVGREDLAQKVKHVAEEQGDGLGYDVLSYEENGSERYIEVKTTTKGLSEAFYITKKELECSEENKDKYFLYRVYNFDQSAMNGKIGKYKGGLMRLVSEAWVYKATCESV